MAALQKQILSLVFAKGINTSVDPKVQQSELLELENGLLDRVGAITKRHGTTSITNAAYTHDFITKHRDRPVLIDHGSLRVFDGALGAAAGNFDLAAAPYFADIAVEPLSSVKRSHYYYPDLALLGAVLIVAFTEYKDVSGTMTYVQRAATYDTATGLKLDDVELQNGSETTRRFPRIGISTTGYVWYVNSSEKLAYHTVSAAGDISATAAWTDTGTSAHATSTSLEVCNCEDANHTQIVTFIDVNNDVQVKAFDGTHVGQTSIVGGAVDYTDVGAFRMVDNSVIVLAGYLASPREVRAQGFDAALSTTMSLVTVAPLGANYRVSSLTGIATGTGTALILWTEEHASGTGVLAPYVRRATLTISGSTGTPSAVATWAGRVKLASKLFNRTDPHVLVHFNGFAASGGTEEVAAPAQSSYFLMREADASASPTAEVVGKALVGRGGPGNTWTSYTLGSLSSVITSGSSYLVGALFYSGVSTEAWKQSNKTVERFDDVGFAKLTVTIGAPSQLKCEEANGLLLIPNSSPYQWDGQQIVEQGFHTYPEGLALSASTSGGHLADGAYGWAVTYEWQDAQGQVHRSCPSPTITYACSGGGTSTITITVPGLSLTRKVGAKIVLWRTKCNGAILYRHLEAAATASGTIVYNASFSDTYADSALANRPQLYTTGSVVENIQPQPHRVQCLHQGRHLFVDREAEKTTVRYSRWLIDGEGPGWNDVMAIAVPEEGGPITALATFQDRILIFKESMIWECHGNGLDDSGTGQDYSVPALLCTGYGCTNQKTIVALPEGLAFLSGTGLALLKADFTLDPRWGMPVKFHTDTLTLVAGALIPDMEYAIWIASDAAATALVYGYNLGQWSTFTAHRGVDAVECGGVLYRKDNATSIVVEDRTTHLDDSGAIPMKLTTGWIGGPEVRRLYEVSLIGQNINAHKLYFQPRFDLDPVWDSADRVEFNAGTLGSAFDYSAFYGSGLASTYADKAYELTAGTRRSKHRRLQFRIYDGADGATPLDEGFSITAVSLLLGMRPDPYLGKATAREMS